MFTWMKQSKLSLLLALILAVGLLVGGCGGGSDSYDTSYSAPELTQTATPLIEVVDLKEWVDAGLVNAGDIRDNVVIFHVGPGDADPAEQKIPGAYLWDEKTELTMSRIEGLGEAGSQVIVGELLETVLRRAGVNKKSVIVLTGESSFRLERAYFTLRYWGFPKENIKLLNGGTPAWETAGYATTTSSAASYPSNFSLYQNGTLRDDLRYSIGEMIQKVDANNASIAAGNGPIVNIIQQTTSTPAIANAIGRGQGSFYDTDRFFKDAAGIIDVLENGPGPGAFVEGLPTITHCVSGMSCTPIFFALDAILGLNVAVYDGSTSQWENYKDKPEGITVANDSWRTDLYGRSQGTGVRNDPVILPLLNSKFTTISDEANETENEDKEYIATPPTTRSTSVSGDASGC